MLLVLMPLVVIGVALWHRELLAAIPLAVGLNGIPLVFGGTNVRVEQIIGVALSLALGTSVVLGQRRLFVDRTAKWLAVVAFLHFLASALFSPARFYSLQQSASLLAVWTLYIVITNYIGDARALDTFFRTVIQAGILYSTIGIAAFLLKRAGFEVGGANVDAASTAPFGAFGTMYEPNIYGSYCAAYFIVALAIIAFGELRRDHTERGAWSLLLAAGAGLMLSFTRGAWLGALAGIGVVVFLASRIFGVRIRPARLLLPVAVLAAFSIAFWYLPFDGAEFFRYKVRNLVNVQSDNAIVRLLTYSLALEQFVRHPLLGWGTFSFAPLTTEGLPFREFEGWHALWIGNFLLQELHDIGVVGLLAFLAMLWSLMMTGYRLARLMLQSDVVLASRHLALLAAFVTLLVAFVFTTGFPLGYPWMFAGLLGAFSRVSGQRLGSAETPMVARAA